jgi:hypothetical protein
LYAELEVPTIGPQTLLWSKRIHPTTLVPINLRKFLREVHDSNASFIQVHGLYLEYAWVWNLGIRRVFLPIFLLNSSDGRWTKLIPKEDGSKMVIFFRLSKQVLTHKHTKYDPLINNIQNQGWKTNPLITITIGVRGARHEQSINKLDNLKIPKSSIKTLMENIHQNAIKYLTYLVPNKRKLEN